MDLPLKTIFAIARVNYHCVKIVQIRSYFWCLFPPHSDWIHTRSNSLFGHFSRSVFYAIQRYKYTFTHFCQTFQFYTPWKHEKTKGSLVFSGSTVIRMLAGNWLTCIILQTYHMYSTLKRPGNCRFVSTWNIGAVFVFIHKTLFTLKWCALDSFSNFQTKCFLDVIWNFACFNKYIGIFV